MKEDNLYEEDLRFAGIAVGPLYKGHLGTLILLPVTQVSSIQRSFNTLQYYTGTQNGVLIIEVSTF